MAAETDPLLRALRGKDGDGSHSDEHAEERAGPAQHDQDQIDAAQQVFPLSHGGCQDTTQNNRRYRSKSCHGLLTAIATSPKSRPAMVPITAPKMAKTMTNPML